MSQPSGNGNHRNFPYTSQPTGWFQLGWSQDFPAGVVVPLHYFSQDLVAYVQNVGDGFTDLREWVEGALAQVDQRLADAHDRIDGCVAYRSLVRYDAYGEMSGHQSSSVALLDARKSGVVISSILHRDQARVYVKQLTDGVPTLELSPEEQEAVDTALAGGVQSPA